MSKRNTFELLIKLFGLFSAVRGYNLLVLVLAQFLCSIFILAPGEHTVRDVVFDVNLLLIVLASSLVVAGGYLINNFYDTEKDLINRPHKTTLDAMVSPSTKLRFYFAVNALALLLASFVSGRAVLFFLVYGFAIWLYSHRLKRLPILGNLTSSILMISPFFAIFIYYKNFETVIFVHAIFLFLVIAMRELTKDLENLKGDLALNYRTIPVVYGETVSHAMLTVLALLTLIPSYLLIYNYDIGLMDYYFLCSMILLILFIGIVWISRSKRHYLLLHNLLKFIIVSGVFSILLIDVDLVINRIF